MFLISAMGVNAKDNAQQYLEDFTSRSLYAKTPEVIHHLNDGEHYTVLSEDKKHIIAYSYKTGKATDTVFSVDAIEHCPIETIDGYEFSSSEDKLLLNTDSEPIYRHSKYTTYYVYSVKYKTFGTLSDKEGRQNLAAFSPNGRMVAFARGNNLFIKNLDFNTERQITTDGEHNHIINGTADWVYEEEFGTVKYFAWSPDSKHLAYIKFDESKVKEFSFQKYNDSYPTLFTYKYPKAGETNSTVSAHTYDIQNRTTKQLNVGTGNDIYFPIIRWSNKPEELFILRANRNQTQLDALSVNPRTGVATTLLSEKDKVYIDYTNFKSIHFLADNSFITMSERDGWRHLYHFSATGILKEQLTKGDWDVTAFYGYDEKNKTLYFQAAKEHPTERHVYKRTKKGEIINLDSRKGIHSANFTKDFRLNIAQFNNITTPNQYVLKDHKNKEVRTIIDNAELKAKVDAYNLPKKEFITITTEDGITLNAWIVKPTNMESGKQYPLVMTQYSGPNSQEVLNRWRPDWEQYLAQTGYIVACVDSRGTGARGHAFRTCTYWNLGKYETQDQLAAAKYLGSLDYIDKDRMAIWGWSYGGFMTLNCMTFGDVFKAGISIAPVTDWKLYNTAYTERFMSRPQENFDGYDNFNLVRQADKLKGNLLLVHGTADDNVHFQQAAIYAEELVKAGIQFEMQYYTNKNHSILGNRTRLHLYTRFNIFLKNNL